MTTTRKQSLRAAVRAIQSGQMRIVDSLTGCPAGDWPETRQAIRGIEESIPGEWARSYGVADLIAEIWTVLPETGRFARREATR